jgi:hypothetical protein
VDGARREHRRGSLSAALLQTPSLCEYKTRWFGRCEGGTELREGWSEMGVGSRRGLVGLGFLADVSVTGSNHACERRESDKKTYRPIYHGLAFAPPRMKVRPPSSPTTRSFAVSSGPYPADDGSVSVAPIAAAAPEAQQIQLVRRRHHDEQ